MNSGTGPATGIEMLDQILTEHLDFDLEVLLSIEKEDLIHFLTVKAGISADNLEALAELLYMLSPSSPKRIKMLEFSLVIYRYQLENSEDYSLSVLDRINEIEALLNEEREK